MSNISPLDARKFGFLELGIQCHLGFLSSVDGAACETNKSVQCTRVYIKSVQRTRVDINDTVKIMPTKKIEHSISTSPVFQSVPKALHPTPLKWPSFFPTSKKKDCDKHQNLAKTCPTPQNKQKNKQIFS